MFEASIRVRSLGIVAVAMLFAGCSGGGARPAATPAAVTAAVSPTAQAAGTPADDTTPEAGGNDRSEDENKARAAAQEVFGGEIAANCAQRTTAGTCIEGKSTFDTLSNGIMVWAVTGAAGDAGFGVLGRTLDGEWELWFGAQQFYQLVTLPGEVRVCADGEGLNLRKSPATTAERLASLDDGAVVTVDKFVLTEPGTPLSDASPKSGYGWYHLQTAPDGWAYSKYLSDAKLGNCDLRNGLEGKPR